MKLVRFFIVAFFVVFFNYQSKSQEIAGELNCNVVINSQKIQGTNREVFQAMNRDLREFMNNRKWTEHVFAFRERIECTIMISINDQIGSDKFIGTIQVQSRRPVYNTNYYTSILNHKERENDFQFNYLEGQNMNEFDINSYSSNLTSVLAFYAYIIIGLDYDTYSPNGGAPYFQKALTIANNAKSTGSSGPGWQPFENQRNRYWLVENLTNSAYSKFHSCMYSYHRLGFDNLSDKIEQGRAEVAASIKMLEDIYIKKPDIFILDIFSNAKSDELVQLFTGSFATEKQMVVNILKKIDPAKSAQYDKIMEQQQQN